MHLKNFSLFTEYSGRTVLAPAYDLLSTRLALPDDKEDSALTINAKNKKIKKSDLEKLASNLNIPNRSVFNSFARLDFLMAGAKELVMQSFLPESLKTAYIKIMEENKGRLYKDHQHK